jgi:hypothetical protein
VASGCVNGFGAPVLVAKAAPREGEREGRNARRGRRGEHGSRGRRGGSAH